MSAGEQVIAVLNTAGIPAEAAYPGSKMPYLTAIAARVTEESESEGAVTVAVTLLCPFALGNEALKTAGENAANALKALGTVRVEAMGFETRWDCYYRVLRILIPAAPRPTWSRAMPSSNTRSGHPRSARSRSCSPGWWTWLKARP